MDRWLRTGTSAKCGPHRHQQEPSAAAVSADSTTTVGCRSANAEEAMHGLQVQPGKRVTEQDTERVSKKCKYDESYIELGFTWTGDAGYPQPQCVLCGEVLPNNSLKPSLLRQHLETEHNQFKDKPAQFFNRKLEELKSSKKILPSNSCMEYVNALRASYFMSYRVAKTGEPHTITEDFLIPAMKAVVKCMLGEKAEEKLDSIPLSNDTVSRCIADMAENVLSQLVNRVRNSDYYSLQLDKSTDLDSLAKLLVYVRYMYESTIHEDFLFCHSLPTQTTEEEIFLLLDNFMSENRIDWSRCVGISTDGAKSMMGKHSGVVVRIKAVATEATWVYCSIDREALASQKMPENLMSVLSDAVKMVNFITGQCQNSRIFATLCDEMGNDHLPLLMHTEVCWLSHGKVLTRLFELHSELQVFFTDHLPFAQSSCLEDTAWLQRLAYLADIFSCLNELSLGLQGLSTTIFKTQDKIESMIKKLLFWDSCLKRNEIDSFPTLQEFLAANDNMVLHESVKADIMEHLQQLSKQLRKYFPKMDNANSWIRNPFKVPQSLPIPPLPVREQEKLLDLSCDSGLKLEFECKPLADFWVQRMEDYPYLSKLAVKFLMPFSTTYLCETGFSALMAMETEYPQRLNAENDLRLKLSPIFPAISDLCDKKQGHPSH